MRVEGVEFVGLACFDRQFVPIRDGLILLVGKNNAGKTAILRGLTVLREFFVANRQGRSELTAYARQDNPEPYFHFEVLVRPENSDPLHVHFLDADEDWWKLFNSQYHPTLAYRFWVLPSRSDDQVIFQWVQMQAENRARLDILKSESGISLLRYEKPAGNGWPTTPSVLLGKEQTSGRGIYTPDGKSHIVPLQTTTHFEPLLPLSRARYVAPHRMVAPALEIKTAMDLPDTAENLSIFLQTLHGRNREQFERIEKFVTEVFPEFSRVNPSNDIQNRVSLTLTRKDVNRSIPLSHCGTGVEQLLAIATFVVTAEPGAILLIDEPHSFLHPTAERQLVDFLTQDHQHKIVISTHSAIFINSVESERITYLKPPGRTCASAGGCPKVSQILSHLRYRNYDVLFYVRLIAVEGRSDSAILPKLLLAVGLLSPTSLSKTGFPSMEGAPGNVRSLQTGVLRLERLITGIGRSNQPRLYLFTGDRTPEEMTILQNML